MQQEFSISRPAIRQIIGHDWSQRARPLADEKAVQNTKRERWDGEQVHRCNGFAMVSEERQPLLDGIWISQGSPDPSRDTPFRKIETQLAQFAVNALSFDKSLADFKINKIR
jgi:hypothetical protein